MINSDLIHEPSVLKLTDRQFRREMEGAMRGVRTALSPFVRIGGDRPWAKDWAEIRSAIFARDNYTCTYCGERGRKLQCDHIVPVSKGGLHGEDNLTTACEPCNRSKGAKLLSGWIR